VEGKIEKALRREIKKTGQEDNQHSKIKRETKRKDKKISDEK